MRTELEGTCMVSDARAVVCQSAAPLRKSSFIATHFTFHNALELVVHITLKGSFKQKSSVSAKNQHIHLRYGSYIYADYNRMSGVLDALG